MAKKQKPEKTMFNFQIDTDLLEKGKELAHKKGISFSGLLRQLLIQELEKQA